MTQNPSFTNVAHRWMGYLDINSSLLMSQFESLTNQMWVTSTPLSNSVQVMSETDHPLSQSENSVWKKYFTLENVRSIVRKDVQRTFPEDPFFRASNFQLELIQLLCMYCLDHHVTYEQGMHELCAVVLWILHHDSQVLSTQRLAYGYALFQGLMKLQRPLFEHDTASQVSYRFFHIHLRAIDPLLYKHLNEIAIEPHLFGIRWLRLLLAREWSLIQVAQLWEGLLAMYAKKYDWLETLSYLCATLVVAARPSLISSDYNACMEAFMKTTTISSKIVFQTMLNNQKQYRPIIFDLTQRASFQKSHPYQSQKKNP